MEAVLRAIAIYLFLMVLFRISGRRSLGDITTFDFVLLLIISEATQQAMLGENFSLTNGFLVVLALVSFDIAMSLLMRRFPGLSAWVQGKPLIIVDEGRPLRDLMRKARVEEDDILTAARITQGLERMDQIKYAVLERSGGISIVPRR